MNIPDRLRLPLDFDAERLSAEAATFIGADWIRHFVQSNYEGDWSVVPLRAKRGAVHPVAMIYSDPACDAFDDTPFLAACPYLREVLNAFQCPLESARLMRLGPGSAIKTHTDHDLRYEEGKARIHVPVLTNPGVEFVLNGRPAPLAAGETWYLRLSDPHSVVNRGDVDRVHLVVDMRVDAWLAALFERALSADASR